MSQNDNLLSLGIKAKAASYKLMNLSSRVKETGLNAIKLSIVDKCDDILEANAKDIEDARAKGMSESMIDRLALNKKRIEEMAEGIDKIITLPDPIGEVIGMWKRPNGIQIGKMRVSLGVVGIIYEARPNVTLDAAVLCLKTGNAVILRGGSEAINSNIAIVNVMRNAIKGVGITEDAIAILEDTSRETAGEMMRLNKYIDVLIPRGGAGLINTVVNNSTIPVIETGVGNCHVFVDKSADFIMAKEIIINAKTSRPSVCNSIENTLIDSSIAEEFVPYIFKSLIENKVEIRCCELAFKLWEDEAKLNLTGVWERSKAKISRATDEDYFTEYNELIISVKVVNDIDDAIVHINKYGSRHSEAIITSNYERSQKFLTEIDAAAVYVNASTRFTDGNEFGFGAEIGISTQKLHARGPMGLEALTTYKYIVYGNGQIR